MATPASAFGHRRFDVGSYRGSEAGVLMVTANPTGIPYVFDPGEMARRGRLGARRRLALCDDPRELTAAARAAFLGRFRTEAERTAYFRDLGRKSAEARRARCAAGEGGGHDRAA